MTRFRGAAALLAAVILTALVGAGVAAAAPPRLSPTPPVQLPAHVARPRHHHAAPARRKRLPKTGLEIGPLLLAATAMISLGYGIRIVAAPR